MSAKTPIRAIKDGNGAITGFSEFQSTEFIEISKGGTGAVTGLAAANNLHVVSFDAQTLTSPQKTQVLTNLGAGASGISILSATSAATIRDIANLATVPIDGTEFGFVVGDAIVESAYKNMYPITMPIQMSDSTASAYSTFDDAYSGFHTLGGLYDDSSKELKTMRKSAIVPYESETLHGNGGDYGANDHSHTDWPDNRLDQLRLLTENPYADSLYYHSTRLSFLLTGITIPDSSEKASNHRGVVRMLIVRPRIPTVKTRWSGASSQPMLNMDYPPHFDTDLFYTKTKTLGGRMDTSIVTRNPQTATSHNARKTHLTPTFGLLKYASVDPVINQQTTVQSGVANSQLHYGHPIPTEGTAHTLSSYDVLTAPVNREKYAVVVDKMVTLDTLHHGVASKRIENVVIPYYNPLTKRNHRYHVDNYVVIKEDNAITKYLVEIKPYKQTLKPTTKYKQKKHIIYEQVQFVRNQAKWEAARKYCKLTIAVVRKWAK